MERVNGGVLKAALRSAAAKQVAAAGHTIETAVTTFVGKTAFAVWSRHYDNRIAFRINYPALSNEATLTRIEADLIGAYTLHETGHVLYSNNNDYTIGDVLMQFEGNARHRGYVHKFANGIEDGRMENAVIQAGIARNAKVQFGRLLNMLCANMDKAWNPCDLVHAPFTLALLSRQVFGNGNAFTATLLDRIPEPKRSLYARVVDECRSAPQGYDADAWAFRVAAQFVSDWEKITGKTRMPSVINFSEQGTTIEGNSIDRDADDYVPAKSDVDGDGFGRLDPENADTEGDGDGDGFEDYGDDDGDDDGPNVLGDSLDGGDDEGDEDDEGGAGHIGGGWDDETVGDTTPFADVDTSSGAPISAEPDIDSLFKRISKREAAASSPLDAFIESDDYGPLDSRMERFGHHRKISLDEIPMGGLKTQLFKLLKSEDRVGWEQGSTSGRFDVKRTTRMLSGSTRVFKHRTEQEATTSAGVIVIDTSGSMNNERLTRAAQAAWAIATCVERAGCDIEVVAYGGSQYLDRTSCFTDMSGAKTSSAAVPAYSMGETMFLKRFNETCASRKNVFEALPAIASGGSTPDYHVVRSAADRLLLHPAKRRFVISITDGQGDFKLMKLMSIQYERLHNIQVLGIGIQTPQRMMDSAYTRSACVQEIQDLGATAMRSLIEQLKGHGDTNIYEKVQEEEAY